MIKRTLYFGNPAYLNLRNEQLEIHLPQVEKSNLPESFKKEAVKRIPIEDIGIIIIDHKQITITQGLIAALMDKNAALISCDETHLPNSLQLPLSGNTIQTERFKAQINASEPLKKQIWAQVVEQKIKNQAALLEKRSIDHRFMIPLYKNVKSGDTGNCEATAAAYYWEHIFIDLPNPDGEVAIPKFRRLREGQSPNNFLNYGYAILRATMARSIVGAGLLPTLGIFHHNRYNAYCLADDLMEPYRPFVDEVVCNIVKRFGLDEDIPKEIKAELLQMPALDVELDGEKSPLMNATQRTAVSLVKCFNGEERKILLPLMVLI